MAAQRCLNRQYATGRGETAYELSSTIIDSNIYDSLGDNEKSKAIELAYEIANEGAKHETLGAPFTADWRQEVADMSVSDAANFILNKAIKLEGSSDAVSEQQALKHGVDPDLVVAEVSEPANEFYQQYIKPADVSASDYLAAYRYKGTTGTKKEDVLEYVNTYYTTYSTEQKDAIYLSLGYAESVLYDAPWN